MGPNSNQQFIPQPHNPSSSLWLQVAFWISIAISVAVVLRRVLALASPSQNLPPPLAALDHTFASHTALTLAHILPALAFVLISPLIVFRRFANLDWPERVFFPLGVLVAFTAYAMSVYSVGGWTERSAVLLFNTLFLMSLSVAYRYRLRGEQAFQRRWTLRSLAILLGIATTRPVMGIFFATSRLTHLVPSQFFGIAFWIGFSINTLAFELWVHTHDRKFQHETLATISGH
jgi:hypothetical protein